MEDYKQITKKVEPEMEKAFHFLQDELNKIHTSRVSPALVENIKVAFFGQEFPLKQLGSISVQGPRELLVHPWDQSYLEPMAAAIAKSGISGQAAADKQRLRIIFPSLSEEYRKDVVKKVHELAEKTRQTIRKLREGVWADIQDKQRAGEIREDDKFRAKDELQEFVDKYNEKIEEAVQRKEKELSE